MEIWELYLLTRLDAVGIALGITIILTSMTLTASWLVSHGACTTEDKALFGKIIWKVLPVLVVCVLMQIILPTSKQAYTILGGHYVTNIENVEKLSPNMVKAANKFLEVYVEDGVIDE